MQEEKLEGKLESKPSFDAKKVFVDESFADIVPWFLDNRKEDINKLKEMVEAEDFEQIHKMGHRWKGTCASYGFQKLSEAGEILENLSLRKSKQEILDLLSRTGDYIGTVEVVYVAPNESSSETSV
jgi:HPt (histidine-containing phosphotransfer) domain-containing protein